MIRYTTNAKALSKQIQSAIQDKEGRKILRRSSQVALEVINEESGKRGSQLPLKRKNKRWRRAIKQKGSYKYRYEGLDKKKGGKFKAITGVNYAAKKKILKLSHLIEGGFKHKVAGSIKGFFFRQKSYDAKSLSSMKSFRNAFFGSVQYLMRTGKAPSLKQTRSFR